MIVVVGILFFPSGSNYYMLAVFALGGLYSIYAGTRNFRRKDRKQQQQAYWYTEPRILVGLAMFLGIPWRLLQINAANIPFNTIAVENAIVVLALLLFLTAGYFFFRKLMIR